MPEPLSLSATNIKALRTAGLLTTNDYISMALLNTKAVGAEQTIGVADFVANWGVTDDQLVSRLIAMSRGTSPTISLTIPQFEVTWATNPSTDLTETEFRQKVQLGIFDDLTAQTYYALLFTKGATATQQVDPANYSTSFEVGGWGITPGSLLRECLSMAVERNNQPAVFSNVAFTTVTALWLQTYHS